MMKKHWNKKVLRLNDEIEGIPVLIVNNGMIAGEGIADGRLLPAIIIDCSVRPDIQNVLRTHRYFHPGDVNSAWTRTHRSINELTLFLHFLKPHECVLLLEFDISSHGGLIDRIVDEQGLYIQCGQEGDRLVSTLGSDRILVEIPSTHFDHEWRKMWRRSLVKFYKKQGANRSDANRMANEMMAKWRSHLRQRPFGHS